MLNGVFPHPHMQKPILLQGHERSITQIKYNREGDLLFTVAKDPVSMAEPAGETISPVRNGGKEWRDKGVVVN